jgi:hypothetical protein
MGQFDGLSNPVRSRRDKGFFSGLLAALIHRHGSDSLAGVA